MAYQLIINVKSSSILSSLSKVLGAMEGVTIEKKTRLTKKDTTQAILQDPQTMESIRRGEKDMAEGRYSKVSLSDIQKILGI